MKIPKKVNIKGREYTIIRRDLSKENCQGYVSDTEIVLHDKLKGRALVTCLLHECLHSVWEEVGLNQTRIPLDLQEVCVEAASTFLADTFTLRFKGK